MTRRALATNTRRAVAEGLFAASFSVDEARLSMRALFVSVSRPYLQRVWRDYHERLAANRRKAGHVGAGLQLPDYRQRRTAPIRGYSAGRRK